jgi:outer membrane protein assembly factor BamB
MKFSEKDVRIYKGISLISGVFTVVIAITMLFSLIQLKVLDPINSPSLQSVKEQFDRDPDNKGKVEQVRAIDLMARKAYFSSRWQVETGSYLLLAGAIVFVFFQRLVAGSEKPVRALLPDKPDIETEKIKNRRYLIISAGAVTVLAIISSFVLRTQLPAPGRSATNAENGEPAGIIIEANLPGDINYPFFRGEGSRGIAGGTGYPSEWNGTVGNNIKWKIAVPKPGKNSPVIWGDKLFLTGAVDADCEIYCINKKTGKTIWTGSGSGFQGASSEAPETDAEAGMAVPTAAVSENEVCAVFGNGNLVCFDHDGKLKWGKNVGVPQGTYGYSSSLVIYEKLLLVQYDSQDKITLSGYELGTGELKWETIRSGRPVNSSPVLANFDGQPQLLINGNPNISAFDPVSGKELWSLPGVSGDVAPSLAVNSKMVFAAQDYFNVIALKPGKAGSTAWQDNTFTPDASSPVANDKFLFIATGSGDVACYDSEKGDTLWSHYFEEPFYSSPVIADGNVYFLDRAGTMHIVKAAGEFQLVAESPVGERTDCTPAFSEKAIYIRTNDNLYCISNN